MSMDAISWAMKQSHLPPIGKFVLLCLADNAYEDQAAVGICRIAQYTNLTASEVPAVIDQLVAAGVIQRAGKERYLLDRPLDRAATNAYRKKPNGSGLRLRVFERDGYACLRCGSRQDLRADHVVPEKLGGKGVIENLQTLCLPCNSWKGTKTIDFRCKAKEPA